MAAEENLKLMDEVKKHIAEYLQGELDSATKALEYFEKKDMTIGKEESADIKKSREVEAIKLRQTIYDLNRYLSVIKRM